MNKRKGIILAGGSGTRLYPITKSVSKQLLPVYDKPMIYYPLCTLMSCGIKEILIITTPEDNINFKKLLGSGKQWGLDLEYVIQDSPNGLAQAFILGENFIDGCPSALILGDNIFHGQNINSDLNNANNKTSGASVFAYHVSDPQRYGVVCLDKQNKPMKIEEKPVNPVSNLAVTGLYFYDKDVCNFAKTIVPSDRGEYEITDLNNIYLKNGSLDVQIMDSGSTWLDTGTHNSLLEASSLIATIQKRQGLMVACPEEIAYKNNWIKKEDLIELSKPLLKSNYGKYLTNILIK
jgi:glucose-1-phosphate thymidylyltransferase